MTNRHRPRILLGVTADLSLILLRGFPEYLADRGWDVHVVSSPGPHLEELSQHPGISVHEIAMRRSPSPWHDARALIRWRSVIRAVRPDVVSVGTPKAGLLGGLAAWLCRVPARVYLLRGLRLETATGAGRRLLTFLEWLSCQVAHEVIAVSESLRTMAVELRISPASKVKVLGHGSSNGVDLSRYDPLPASDVAELRNLHHIAPNIPTIGFVGRLSADKGLGMLATARRILVSQGIDHQLLIVGPLEDASHELLHELRSGGRSPIEVGFVADTAPFYQLIDILCLPTYREGFPNVVLEAAATGRPTVTTDATGAVDSVVNDVTGFIFPIDSSEAFADRLRILIEDTPRRLRQGAAARDRVERLFKREFVWENTETEYRALAVRSMARETTKRRKVHEHPNSSRS